MPKLKKPIGDARDPEGLVRWTNEFVDYLRVRNYSQPTLVTTESALTAQNAAVMHPLSNSLL